VKETAPFFRGSSVVKAEKFEGNREAREALTLSVAGVILAMVIWSLMMLLFYWAQQAMLTTRLPGPFVGGLFFWSHADTASDTQRCQLSAITWSVCATTVTTAIPVVNA
jgi:hypothetical protein